MKKNKIILKKKKQCIWFQDRIVTNLDLAEKSKEEKKIKRSSMILSESQKIK